MRGREKFKKYKWILSFLTGFYGLFPRRVRESLLTHYRGRKGNIGLVIRYSLLKTLAKSVGDNVSIFPDVYLYKIHNLSVGDNVSIQPLCYLDAGGGISIGNDVSIARNVSIIAFNHKFDDLSVPIKDQGVERKEITIKDNVWIGVNSVLLAGVTVNSGCVIGAGSVVTHDIAENSIAAGVPAKVIKSRESL